MIENYIMHILILICIYIIFAVVQNVTSGNLGLLSMGNVVFFGLGAYTSAILTLRGVSFFWAFILAMLMGGLSAVLMSFLMRKLKGDYYAIGTLAYLFVIYSVFLNWTSVTRGPLGLPGIPKPVLFGVVFNTVPKYLVLSVFLCVMVVLFFYCVSKSKYNLVMGSIRDNEIASNILGYDTFRIKMQVMFIVGMFSALAGVLFAHYITFIDPSSFYMAEVIFILTIVIIGGLGSLKGAVWGTVILIMIPEILRFVGLPSSLVGPVRQILYALILIVIVWFRPKGIFGEVEV